MVLSVSAATVAAEDIESVILTTDTNYPDTLVASLAANKIGAPVLLTSARELPAETEEELNNLSPSNIYIIGGPAVVSKSLEESLSIEYTVVRLWGMTRYGTAVEVAEYFWESAPQALLVWDALKKPGDGNSELVSEARDLAMQDEMPMLLIGKNHIPGQVVDALNNLSVESVVLVGNVGSDVIDTLDEMGIEISEQIKGEDVNKTRTKLRDRIMEKLRTRTDRPLVVVAIGNWSDTIKAPYRPNGTSRHITSEGQIDDLIAEIQDNNYSRIKVVGKPALAQIVYDRLTDAGIEAELISGGPAKVAANITRKELARIKQRLMDVKHELEAAFRRRIVASLNDTENIIQDAEEILEQAGISEETKERLLDQLREMKQDIDEKIAEGNYSLAWVLYGKLKGKATRLTWDYKARLESAYKKLLDSETTLNTTIESLRKFRTLGRD
jgi:putative cell wall-binding protein